MAVITLSCSVKKNLGRKIKTKPGHEIWYLLHRRPAKAQASLRICAVSTKPSLFAHMKYGSRQRVWPKIRHLAPLDGCACAIEEWKYGGWKVPKGPTKNQTSSLVGWLRMRVWKMHLQRMKSAIISWAGSYVLGMSVLYNVATCTTDWFPHHIWASSWEIMALFILCKCIFQTGMCNHPTRLDVWVLVGPFVYSHRSCVRVELSG